MNSTAPSAPQAPADWLSELKFDAQGLIPAIAQDADSGAVLMMAWMNAQAVQETARTGQAVYFSRSRKRLWRKGEESGNTQTVREMRLDCDGDVLLLKVTQVGGIACHTGRASCFFRRLDAIAPEASDESNNPAKPDEAGASEPDARPSRTWTVTDPVLKDPRDLYDHPHSHP